MSRPSRYSTEFKRDAVSRMGQGGMTVTALAKQLGIRRKFLYLWRERLQAGGKAALERPVGRPPGSRNTHYQAAATGPDLQWLEHTSLLGAPTGYLFTCFRALPTWSCPVFHTKAKSSPNELREHKANGRLVGLTQW